MNIANGLTPSENWKTFSAQNFHDTGTIWILDIKCGWEQNVKSKSYKCS